MPTFSYRLIRSNRHTVSMEINKDAELIVRAPLRMPASEIRRFVESHADWIESHMEKVQKRLAEAAEDPYPPLSQADLRQLADLALATIPPRAERFAQQIGVTYGRITIRNQRTRWGSCSSAGNLNFNCLLMLTPPEVQEYVIVHELCHRIHMNHSKAFWAEVERVLPDYRKHRKWLKDNGGVIMRRMTG